MFIIILRISASNAFEMFFFGGRGGGPGTYLSLYDNPTWKMYRCDRFLGTLFLLL